MTTIILSIMAGLTVLGMYAVAIFYRPRSR
jgi:hypothetical protein